MLGANLVLGGSWLKGSYSLGILFFFFLFCFIGACIGFILVDGGRLYTYRADFRHGIPRCYI